MKMILAVDSR